MYEKQKFNFALESPRSGNVFDNLADKLQILTNSQAVLTSMQNGFWLTPNLAGEQETTPMPTNDQL